MSFPPAFFISSRSFLTSSYVAFIISSATALILNHKEKTEEVLLTIEETAEKLNLVPNTVRVKINRGELKAVKTGQKWLIRQSAIDEYLMACEERQPLSEKDIESRAATYVALNKGRYGKVR